MPPTATASPSSACARAVELRELDVRVDAVLARHLRRHREADQLLRAAGQRGVRVELQPLHLFPDAGQRDLGERLEEAGHEAEGLLDVGARGLRGRHRLVFGARGDGEQAAEGQGGQQGGGDVLDHGSIPSWFSVDGCVAFALRRPVRSAALEGRGVMPGGTRRSAARKGHACCGAGRTTCRLKARSTVGASSASIGLCRWARSTSRARSASAASLTRVTSKRMRSQVDGGVPSSESRAIGSNSQAISSVTSSSWHLQPLGPEPAAHHEAGAEARAQQLGRVGAGRSAAARSGQIDAHAAVLVFHLAGQPVGGPHAGDAGRFIQ